LFFREISATLCYICASAIFSDALILIHCFFLLRLSHKKPYYRLSEKELPLLIFQVRLAFL